jgi:hypothetical protein
LGEAGRKKLAHVGSQISTMRPSEIERIKLLATALNTAATSCFTVGIATPLAGYIYNVGGLRTVIGIEI